MGKFVSELHNLVERAYEIAKRGAWDIVLAGWAEIPLIARRCSRYRRRSSGWTFLHQAAYFGQELASRELIRLGAAVGARAGDGRTAADVSQEKGYPALAVLLRRALQDEGSLWAPSSDPDLRPSSNLWSEASERSTIEPVFVAYAGEAVLIPRGARYFADSFDRALIGWHGTYDPPSGMAGESML